VGVVEQNGEYSVCESLPFVQWGQMKWFRTLQTKVGTSAIASSDKFIVGVIERNGENHHVCESLPILYYTEQKYKLNMQQFLRFY
jgi:hypothetical protein